MKICFSVIKFDDFVDDGIKGTNHESEREGVNTCLLKSEFDNFSTVIYYKKKNKHDTEQYIVFDLNISIFFFFRYDNIIFLFDYKKKKILSKYFTDPTRDGK